MMSQNRSQLRTWLVFLAASIGNFISILDITIVHISLPQMAIQLHTSIATAGWIIHAYNLVFAAALIPAGRLADQFGRKRFFLLGMGIFGGSSLLCAMAPTVEWLIAFRALQALGGACVASSALALVYAVFPTSRRSRALAVWSAIAALAAVAGPVIGGVVTAFFSWNWIFLVNIPLCVVGCILTLGVVSETRGTESKKVDVVGLAMFLVTICSLLTAVVQGNAWGWSSAGIRGCLR
jgi:MFS family permease